MYGKLVGITSDKNLMKRTEYYVNPVGEILLDPLPEAAKKMYEEVWGETILHSFVMSVDGKIGVGIESTFEATEYTCIRKRIKAFAESLCKVDFPAPITVLYSTAQDDAGYYSVTAFIDAENATKQVFLSLVDIVDKLDDVAGSNTSVRSFDSIENAFELAVKEINKQQA